MTPSANRMNEPEDEDIKYAVALDYLKNLRKTGLSFQAIASKLNAALPKRRRDAATIFHWLHPEKFTPRQNTKRDIIEAVDALKEFQARPPTIKAGVVTEAADMLPVLLLPTLDLKAYKFDEPPPLKAFNKKYGVFVELVEKPSVEELLALLEKEEVDFIAAPRHALEVPKENAQKFPSVRRFVKIAVVETWGFFPAPIEKDAKGKPVKIVPDRGRITEYLRRQAHRQPRPSVAVLANGDYDYEYSRLGKEHTIPPAVAVANSTEAVKQLLDGKKCCGVVGSRLMIANTQALLKLRAPELAKTFEIVPQDTFSESKMDAWVKPKYLMHKSLVAAKIFHLLYDAEEQIRAQGHTPSFRKKTNALLGLDKLDTETKKEFKGAHLYDADELFGEFTKWGYFNFIMQTFECDTLKDLW